VRCSATGASSLVLLFRASAGFFLGDVPVTGDGEVPERRFANGRLRAAGGTWTR
jgi:hypothetical protein